MGYPNHIFVATDFSESAEAAVERAGELAKAHGSKVTLFHSFDPEPLVPPGAIPNPAQFRAKIASEMHEAVDARLRSLAMSHFEGEVDVLVAEERSASHAICEAARRVGADLVVVATHGRTGLRHLLIGSVAERVVRHAHCPVLAVRPVEA